MSSDVLKIAGEETAEAEKQVNEKINELGNHTGGLKDALESLQRVFDEIRGIPNDDELTLQELKKVRAHWISQVRNIESDLDTAKAKTVGSGAAGATAGVAVAALGPHAVMGFVTTFGVASTGTPIAALSGAAASNATLAAIGGGSLATGGGGMLAGAATLGALGPIGWTIVGVSLLGGGLSLIKGHKDRERLNNIFLAISHRDTKSYQLAAVELNERMERIENETEMLEKAVEEVKQYGTEYDQMSQQAQVTLGTFFNLMNSSTQLLVEPIMGLRPKFTEEDYYAYADDHYSNDPFYKVDLSMNDFTANFIKSKIKTEAPLTVALANLLYEIELDDKDEKVLRKALIHNKEFMNSVHSNKKAFDEFSIFTAQRALKFKRAKNTSSDKELLS